MLEPAHHFVSEGFGCAAILLHAVDPPGHPIGYAVVSLLGKRAAVVDQSFHLRHGGHGQAGATDVQGLQSIDLATALEAEHILARHAHGLQRQLIGGRPQLPHLGFVLTDDQSFRMSVDHQAGDALLRLCIKAEYRGHAAVRNPHLGAGKLPVVVPELAIALAQLSHIREWHGPRSFLVIRCACRVVGFIVVIVKVQRRRLAFL